MVADALRLEVKKDGFSQLQSGSYKLTVTLNPTDLDDNAQDLLMDFIKSPMGSVYMLGMARVDVDTGEPARTHTAPLKTAAKPKTPFHDKPLSVQAGIRCSDQGFRNFLATLGWTGDTDGELDAASIVRRICCVRSRKELDTDGQPALDWQALNAKFEEWAGYLPEQR